MNTINIYFKTRTAARNFAKGVDNYTPRENLKRNDSEFKWPVEVTNLSDADLLTTVRQVNSDNSMDYVFEGTLPTVEVKNPATKKVSDMSRAREWWSLNRGNFTNLKPKAIQDQMHSELGIQRNSCRAVYYNLLK